MQTLEDRYEKDKIRIWLEIERRLEREREEYKNWLKETSRDFQTKLEAERQDREEQRKKDWEEWKRKLEEERIQKEKEWDAKLQKEREGWNRKLEEEKRQCEEERRKAWEEWERRFQQQKIEDRKKWEEMVMRLGTLVEDTVAPNIETIAKKYFGCVDVEFDGLRIKKRHSTEKGKVKEFDFILVCEDIILVNETKANPRPEYAKEFVEFIKSGELWEYFPEYKNKRLIPVSSTLYMPENIVRYLTDNGIYAMGMKGDEMDILNFQELNR